MRIELMISCSLGRRFNQLSYGAWPFRNYIRMQLRNSTFLVHLIRIIVDKVIHENRATVKVKQGALILR